ncbi:MAG TPA: FAD-dependent thymidylate synthase [Nitrososphaerales archaeon]|nr:FAD-dependent thymidylate synthase [Nitrososphaerales archaeon]
MKATLVWSVPKPEKVIAVAMRRCYSTKPIEEIEAELEQKGPEYWKYLMTRALQDKSLDVIEHFVFSVVVDGMPESEAGRLALGFPYVKFLRLGEGRWLVSMNARTLVEIWRGQAFRGLAEAVVAEFDRRDVCPIFNSLVFGERGRAG